MILFLLGIAVGVVLTVVLAVTLTSNIVRDALYPPPKDKE